MEASISQSSLTADEIRSQVEVVTSRDENQLQKGKQFEAVDETGSEISEVMEDGTLTDERIPDQNIEVISNQQVSIKEIPQRIEEEMKAAQKDKEGETKADKNTCVESSEQVVSILDAAVGQNNVSSVQTPDLTVTTDVETVTDPYTKDETIGELSTTDTVIFQGFAETRKGVEHKEAENYIDLVGEEKGPEAIGPSEEIQNKEDEKDEIICDSIEDAYFQTLAGSPDIQNDDEETNGAEDKLEGLSVTLAKYRASQQGDMPQVQEVDYSETFNADPKIGLENIVMDRTTEVLNQDGNSTIEDSKRVENYNNMPDGSSITREESMQSKDEDLDRADASAVEKKAEEGFTVVVTEDNISKRELTEAIEHSKLASTEKEAPSENSLLQQNEPGEQKPERLLDVISQEIETGASRENVEFENPKYGFGEKRKDDKPTGVYDISGDEIPGQKNLPLIDSNEKTESEEPEISKNNANGIPFRHSLIEETQVEGKRNGVLEFEPEEHIEKSHGTSIDEKEQIANVSEGSKGTESIILKYRSTGGTVRKEIITKTSENTGELEPACRSEAEEKFVVKDAEANILEVMKEQAINTETHKTTAKSIVPEEGLLDDDTTEVCSAAHTGGETVEQRVQMDSPKEAPTKSSEDERNKIILEEGYDGDKMQGREDVHREQIVEANVTFVKPEPSDREASKSYQDNENKTKKSREEDLSLEIVKEGNVNDPSQQYFEEGPIQNFQHDKKEAKKSTGEICEEPQTAKAFESIAPKTIQNTESQEKIPGASLVKQEEGFQGKAEYLASAEASAGGGEGDSEQQPQMNAPGQSIVAKSTENIVDIALVKQTEGPQEEGENLDSIESSKENIDEEPSSIEVAEDRPKPKGEGGFEHISHNDKAGETNHEVESPGEILYTVKQGEGLQGDNENLVLAEAPIQRRDVDISSTKVAEYNSTTNRLAEASENSAKATPEGEEDSENALQKHGTAESFVLETPQGVESPESIPDPPPVKQEEGLKAECKNLAPTEPAKEERGEDTSFVKVAGEDYANIGQVEATENRTKTTPEGGEDSEKVHNVEDPNNNLGTSLLKQGETLQIEGDDQSQKNSSIENASPVTLAEDNDDNIILVETMENSVKVTAKGDEDSEEVLQKDDPQQNLVQEREHRIDNLLVNQEEDIEQKGKNLAPTEVSMENKNETQRNMLKITAIVEDSKHVLQKHVLGESISNEADYEVQSPEKLPKTPLVKQDQGLQREFKDLIPTEASIEKRDEDTSSMKIVEGNNDNNGLADAADHSARITEKCEEASEQVFQKDEPGEKLEQLQCLMSKEIEEESSSKKTTKATFIQEEGLAQNLEQASATEKKEEAQTLDDKTENGAAIKKVVSAIMPEGLILEDEVLREMTKTENTILECVGFETAASSTNTEKSNLEKPVVAELSSSSIGEVSVKASLKEDESGATKIEGTDLDFIKQTETTDLKESKSETLQDYGVPNKDFNAFTHTGKASLEPEVSEEEIKKESLKQEENTIIGSDYQSVGVVSEEAGLKEVEPENNEQTKSSDIAPEGKGLEATETEGTSLDRERIEHHVEGKAPSRGIDNEIAFTMGEAPSDIISEVSSRDSCMMSLQEHEPRITGVSKTVEEIPAREETKDENAKNKSMQKSDEKLTLKEDEYAPSKDISKLTSLDGGNKGVIEEAQKDKDAELHMYPELHNQKNSSDTEDVEISKRGETSCLAEQSEVCELESPKDDNPSNEASKSIAVNTHGDGVEALLEQEDVIQSLTGGVTEEGTADVKTGVGSHESEPMSTKNDEPLAERTLESADLVQKLDFDSESVTKDQSDETHPQTNKSQTEENKDLQDWDSKSVEQKVKLQFQGETERERELKPKLEAEDHIDSSQNAKQTITTVVAMEEVQERVENVDGSEGVKEMAKNGVSDFKEIHEVSDGDEKLKEKDSETESKRCLEATDSNELKETGNTGIVEEPTMESEAPEEEKIQGEGILELADVYITTTDDAEEKIKEEIKVEVDDSLKDNDNTTVVPAESCSAKAQMDDKPVKNTSSDESLEIIKIEPYPRAEEMHERVENVNGSEGVKQHAKHGVSDLKEIHEDSDGDEILDKVKDFGTESTGYLDSTHSNEQKETSNTGIVEEPTMESEAPEEEKIQGEGSLESADVDIPTAEDAEENIQEEIKVKVDDNLEDNHNATVVQGESGLAEAQMDDKPVKDTSSDESIETLKTESFPRAGEVHKRVDNVDGSEGVKEQDKDGVSDLKEIHEVSDGVEILDKVKDSGTESTHSNEEKKISNTGIVEQPTMESEAPGTKGPEEEEIQGEGTLEPADVYKTITEDAEEKIDEDIEVEVDDFLEDNDNVIAVPADSSLAEAKMDDKPIKYTSSEKSLETIKTESYPRAEEVHGRVDNVDGTEGGKEQDKYGANDLKEIHEVLDGVEILDKVKDSGTESTGYLDATDSNEHKETGNTGIVEERTMESEALATKAPREEKIHGEGSLEPADVYMQTAEDAEEKSEEEIKVKADDFLEDNDNAIVVPAESSLVEAQMDDKPVKDTSLNENLENIKTESCPRAEEVYERVDNVDGSEGVKEQDKDGVSDLKETHEVSDGVEMLEKVKESGTESTAYLNSTYSSEEKETGNTALVEEPTMESEAPGTKEPEEEKIQGEGTLEPEDIHKTITEDAEEKIEEEIKVEVDDSLDHNHNATVLPAESSLAEAQMDDKPVNDTSSDESLEIIKTESCPKAEQVHERVENIDGSESLKEHAKHGVSDLKEIYEVSDRDEILETVKESGTESTAYLDSTHSNEEKKIGNTGIVEEPGTKGPEEEEIQGEGTLEPANVYKTITKDANEKIDEDIEVKVDDFLEDNDNVIAEPADSSLAEAKMDDKPIKYTSSEKSLETIKTESYPRAEEVHERVDNVDGSEGVKEQDKDGVNDLKEIHEVSDGVEIHDKVKDSGTESTGYLDATDSNEHKETGNTCIVEERTMELEALGTKAPREEKIQGEGSLETADVYMQTTEDAEEKIEEEIKVKAYDFLEDNDNAIVVTAESSFAEAQMDDKPVKDTSLNENLETIKTESCPRAEEVYERVDNVDGSDGVKEQDKDGVSDLKETHEVSDGVEMLEKVKESGTESTAYLNSTYSNEEKETGNTALVEEPTIESEASGTKEPEEEKIQGEGTLEPEDIHKTITEDAEEKIEEEIKVEIDDSLDHNHDATVLPAESSLAEAQMDDKPVNDTSLDNSLETIKTESCPKAEQVHERFDNVDGSEGVKEQDKDGVSDLKELHEVSDGVEILEKVKVSGTESTGYLDATDSNEHKETDNTGIVEERTMESEAVGTKAPREEKIQGEGSLEPADVYMKTAEDAEETIEEEIKVKASDFLEDNDNAIVVPAETSLAEAQMDDKPVKDTSLNESLETIKTESCPRAEEVDSNKLENASSSLASQLLGREYENVDKVIGTLENPDADEVEESKTVSNAVFGSEYHGVEETPETGESSRVKKLDSDETKEGIKEASGTESTSKSLGIEVVTEDEIAAGQTLAMVKLEEQLQTPSSELLSMEQEHGTMTIVKEIEAIKTEAAEMPDDTKVDSSSTKATEEETCLQKEEQLQTLASALSGEQEHGTTTAFENLERESTREVETLDNMNTSNSSATETKEETCLEKEEPMVPKNVENENVSLDKPDTKEVEETKTVSNMVCGSEYHRSEEAPGTEDGIKEASATVSKSLCTEAVAEDERAADQTLPAGKLADLIQTKSSELLSLEQEHVPTIFCKDTEEIKIKETDRELLQKEEQLQTPSSTLLSEEREHGTTTAFKKAAGEESTKDVETQDEKNINNSSVTKKTEDTCLEQEDMSTKVTSSAESVEKIVESNPPTEEVGSVKLEETSSNLPSQLSNIINKDADKESESLASLENQNKHEVEANKSASVAVFVSKKETGETKQSLSVEKLDAADIEEIKETSETFSKSKASGVEEVSKDELIADQTFPSGKLGEQLQTPSSFLPREQEYGTTTTDERMEEDKIKEVKMPGDEIHSYFSAAKTTEGTCLKNTGLKELETSALGLESSEADPNEEQKEEGSTPDQASKLEPRGMEDIIYADSPSKSKEVRQLTRPAEEASNLKVETSQMTFDHESEVQSDQVLTKSEDIDETHLEAAITDLNNEESQSKKTVEVHQILKDDVSIEEVTDEKEVAKDSKSVSLGEEQIIEGHQRDESKVEEYPPEETNKTFKATTTTNQHKALGFQIPDKDSGSEGNEKNITAQVITVENENAAESYPNETEGKNVEQAAIKLDSGNQSDETNITKGKTEAITPEDKEPDGAISQKEGATDFSEVIEITQNIQQLEKTSYAASKTEIPGEADLSENKETIIRTDREDVIPVLQHKIEESLQKVELEDKIHGRATEVEAEVREVECEGEKRMDDSEEKITEDSTSADLAKISLSKLVQKSVKENLQAAKDLTKECEPTPCKEEKQNEEAETTQIDEAKIDEEEDEHKREDSGSDAPVMVEASKETDVKVAHKKSHNILSGVGSKVKHSLSKVKKAITGKSSHPKTSSPN